VAPGGGVCFTRGDVGEDGPGETSWSVPRIPLAENTFVLDRTCTICSWILEWEVEWKVVRGPRSLAE
jgi:hypothetical protein